MDGIVGIIQEKDTWVQLDDVYPIEADSLLKDRFDGELEQLGKS